MDWKLLQRIALGVFAVAFVVMMLPALSCIQRVTGGLEIGGGSAPVGSDEYADAARANLEQLGSGTGFVGRFFKSVPQCIAGNPPQRQPLPFQAAAGGGLLAFILTSVLARVSYRRQVRGAARRQTAARQVVETRSVSAVRPTSISTSSRPVASTGNENATRSRSATAAPQVAKVDALDVLSALDAEAAQGDWRRDPSGVQQRSAESSKPAEPKRHDPTAAVSAALGANAAPATPAAAQGAAVGGESVATTPLSTPPLDPAQTSFSSPSAADRWGNWDDDDELNELLAGAGTPSGSYGTASTGSRPVASTGMQIAADAGRPEPKRPETRRDLKPVALGKIRVMRVPQRWILGEDLEIAIALAEYDSATMQRVQVTLSLVGSSGSVERIWPNGVKLSELLDAEDIERTGRGRVRVPWPAIAAGLSGRADRISGGTKIRVSVALDLQEELGSATVEDRISVQFVDSHGLALRPNVVRLLDESGKSVRAGVGGVQPGVLDSGWMAPGRYSLEFEDGIELRTRDGRISPRVGLETDGLAALRAGIPIGAVRRLQAVAPDLRWVDPAAGDDGDGSQARPFNTIAAALANVTSRLPGAPPLEIRLVPPRGTVSPREGLAHGQGAANFAAWWEGRAFSTAIPWTVPASAASHRASVLITDDALREDIRLEQIEGIRLVNAAFAGLREAAAVDPSRLSTLDADYGRQAMVVSLAPPNRTQDPFRVEIVACIGVRLEGIRWLGVAGQSGISVADSAGVEIVRCWIEGFEAGQTGRAGVHAVGRGLQVSHTGTEEDPVEVRWCAIGYNRAVRPSVPIRGAAIAAFESTVRLTRCFIHDNAANLDPADVSVDRKGRLAGDGTNFRSGNIVEK